MAKNDHTEFVGILMKADIHKVALGAAIAISAIAIVHFVFSVDVGALDGNLWTWLRASADGSLESNSTTLRNLSLTLGGPLALAALYLAWRRTLTADKQISIQIKQSDNQFRQILSSEKAHMNDRFENAIKNLGSESSVVQSLAITNLSQIRSDSPEDYEPRVRAVLADLLSNMPLIEKNGKIEVDEEHPISIRAMENALYRLRRSMSIGSNKTSQVMLTSGLLPETDVDLNDFDHLHFDNYVLGSILISGITNDVAFQKCTIRSARIINLGRPFETEYHVFEKCRIGEFSFYGELPYIPEVFFEDCNFFDGEPITSDKLVELARSGTSPNVRWNRLD